MIRVAPGAGKPDGG